MLGTYADIRLTLTILENFHIRMHASASGTQVLEQNMNRIGFFFVFVWKGEEVAEALPIPVEFSNH